MAFLKSKKCCVCRVLEVYRHGAKCCGPTCAEIWAIKEKEKEERKASRINARAIKQAKDRIKTRGEYLKEVQVLVNQYIRLRDANDGCISCNKPSTWHGQWHASHFKSCGSSPALRFDLSNIHKSCSICNNWKSGNIGDYRPRLIAKIGQEEVDRLEGPQPYKKWTIDELRLIKAEFKEKLKQLKKERSCLTISPSAQIQPGNITLSE